MEMNKGEAEKCRDIGKKYLRAGNYRQAVKFFEKSHRMYPLPGVEMMRERALEELKKAEEATSSAPTSPHHASGHGHHGVRRRENAAPASESAARAEDPARPYTAEQVQIVNKIRACKNHYEVLAVPQVADDNEIKKAYRKLALKLHPDKNSAPGAEDAFKAVGKAFTVLSDPDKRAHYDRYGDRAPEVTSHRQQRRYQNDEVSPEEIFNMFFGGGFNPNRGRRPQQRGHPSQHGGGQQQDQRGPMAQLMQFLPLLLIFMLSLINGEQRLTNVLLLLCDDFSMQATPQYNVQRTTQMSNVVKGIPYYVERDFERKYTNHWRDLARVEQMVEQYHISRLSDNCENLKLKQKRMIYRARNSKSDDREAAMHKRQHKRNRSFKRESMASNELAAILARRRAKAGGDDGDSGPAIAKSSDVPPPAAAPAAENASGSAAPRTSIAERIARLKQQGAAAAASEAAANGGSGGGGGGGFTPGAPMPRAMPIFVPPPRPASPPTDANSASSFNGNGSSTSVTSTESTETASEEPAAPRMSMSERIKQLQGSGGGINVNPFGAGGAPGGYRKPSYGGGGSSIMTTGDQYAHTHSMGIAMPGMGAAIPMPGLAKTGTRIPGMAAEASEEEATASLDVSHATMTRATGPKRRGPTRAPPGAVRMPVSYGFYMMGGPVLASSDDVKEESPTAAVSSPSLESHGSTSSLFGVSEPTPAPIEASVPSVSLFRDAAPATSPSPSTTTAYEASTATSSLFGSAAPSQPEPQPQPVHVPTPASDDEPVSLFGNDASFSGLSIADTKKDDIAAPSFAVSNDSFESVSLFGAPAAPEVAPTPAPAPVPTPVEAVPAPVAAQPAPAPAVSYSAAPPLVAPTPAAPQPALFAPAPVQAVQAPSASSSSLFGSAVGRANDDSSESDWSDDDDESSTKPGAAAHAPPLFGAGSMPSSHSSHSSLFAAPTPAPVAASPAPTPAPLPASAPVAHRVDSFSDSLFGASPATTNSSYSVAPSSAAPTPVAVEAPAPVPAAAFVPPPRAQPYTSLFGGDDSSSDDDSDDEGGLFGTGLPTR
ncbi:Dnaj subfamily b protein, partial [Globisporangium splendens]